MPIEVRIVNLRDFEALLQVYLRDYIKDPVKEFMEIFYSKYFLNVNKVRYHTKNYNESFFEFKFSEIDNRTRI